MVRILGIKVPPVSRSVTRRDIRRDIRRDAPSPVGGRKAAMAEVSAIYLGDLIPPGGGRRLRPRRSALTCSLKRAPLFCGGGGRSCQLHQPRSTRSRSWLNRPPQSPRWARRCCARRCCARCCCARCCCAGDAHRISSSRLNSKAKETFQLFEAKRQLELARNKRDRQRVAMGAEGEGQSLYTYDPTNLPTELTLTD